METEQPLSLLKTMYRIRLFEERAKRMYKQHLLDGNFLGALHSYIGEEAIAVGVCACLRKDDYVFSTHRGHGHFIAKGGDVKRMLAELQGKATGCSRGRGGSMHLFDPEIGFLGGNGIVGGGIPLALGSAYSAWYRGSDQVTVCFFGDGAASQGTFHEALNLAGLWKLPVVFVCENNCYAVTTGVGETISIANVADRAAGYGLPGKVVDGNDLLAVHEAANAAVARARSGDGASLLECKTYRVDPHCMVLPETRATDELAGWKQKDPIARFEKWLEGRGAGTPADFARVRDEASRDVDEAERFAAQSPYPDVAEFLRECALG